MANKTKIVRNKGKFQTSPGSIKRRLGKPRPGVIDARQRIIQKKRRSVTDARDILARMAKTQDARSKLVKLREKGKSHNGNVRAIGTNILRKTDSNGKISLVTNKNRSQNSMNLKIQEQLGLVGPQRSTSSSRPTKKIITKRPQKVVYEPQIIRKTIRNEYTPQMVNPYSYEHPDVYRWYSGVSPLIAPLEMRRPIMDMTISRGMVSDSSSGEWKTYSSKVRAPNGYVDLDAVEDEEMPMASNVRPGMTRVPSNVHSRLDAKPTANSSHGIMSQPKTKVVVPMGHRIVVSNLQSSVTQDDIRELFEDIGQLLVARLVRPGTAEVIYKNLKDAQKAVDTYHNRQLDGQPMKCLLVNKRPLNNPTAPAIKSNMDSALSRKLPTTTSMSSNKLVPDISTIHKVLFQRN